MPSRIHRRDFTRQALAALGTASLAGMANCAVAGPDDSSWAFPLLGDLHIDRPEHHDMPWLREEHPTSVSQVENYCRVTRELSPRLFAAARQRAVEFSGTVPFIVQLGDLLQGLCGSEALAEQQAIDALDLIGKANFPAPLLMTKGNHDITGPGADAVYNRRLVTSMAQQTGDDIRQPAFTRQRGGTLLVFYDAYNRDSLDWFDQMLQQHQPSRLLFAIHPPVVPYNARATWHVYAQPHQQPQRQRLLELLGKWRAIVLCGHLHKYSYLVRRTESGRFVQLALSSVAKVAGDTPRDVLAGVDAYEPDLVQLEPSHSPDTVEQRRQILKDERRFIEQFDYADSWGYGLVTVTGDRVQASVYNGFSDTPWKSLDLSGPLESDG